MKRTINRWTTTLATVAVLGLPVISAAHPAQQYPAPPPQQQPPPTDPKPAPEPQPAQPQPKPSQPQPTQPQPTQPQPADPQPSQPTATTPQAGDQAVSPQEHLKQAQAALSSITPASVPAKSRGQLAQMKRHLSALERAGSPAAATDKATPPARSGSASANVNWGTEVAAIDKIITEIVGSETATGTSGTTGAPDAKGTTGKAASAVALDEATRAKLMEVRTHITAYAAGMAGVTSTPKNEAAAAEQAGMTSAAAQQAQPPAAAAPAQPTATQPTATQPATPAESAAAAAAPGAQVDAEAARHALTAARDTLSQVTQLPAAAQLTGEARTQVAQLISNFNELITTQSDWRASYAKVSANLTALLGPDSPDAAAAAPATATAGAVGTAGTVELDPALRAKLMELRKTLVEFQKASGGADKDK